MSTETFEQMVGRVACERTSSQDEFDILWCFAMRLREELEKGQEPVGYFVQGKYKGEVIAKQFYWTEKEAKDTGAVFLQHYPEVSINPVCIRPFVAAPAGAPDGWKLAPLEPTPEMIHAVRYAGDKERPAIGEKPVEGKTVWPFVGEHVAERMCHAMLYAAPAAPADAVAKDAERLEWMFIEECLVTSHALRGGGFRYSVDWPGLNESQRETFATPREAIDAAMQGKEGE